MIYVYIKNWWIIKKSETIVNGISYDSVEWLDYNITDKLIYEDWRVVKYDINSKQYRKDHNIDTLEEKVEKLEKSNKRLKVIADREIRNQLRKRSYEKLTEFDYKRYENYFNNK